MEQEEWKTIERFPRYAVSNFGKVKNLKSGKILIPYLNTTGRYQVEIGEKSNRRQFLTYRLVMEAFVGPCPKGLQINHLDMNSQNNSLSNLEYCTAQQNAQYSIRNGGGSYFRNGEKNPMSKLSCEDLTKIRHLISQGYSDCSIGKIFNIDRTNIGKIRRKKTWKWLETH